MKVRLIICGVCRGEFDEGEWEADTRCPECESPKQKAGTRLATLTAPPTSGEALTKLQAMGQEFDATSGEEMRLRERLVALATAEAEYRKLHDLHGDDDMRTGRAWDWMRRKGDEARAALTKGAE